MKEAATIKFFAEKLAVVQTLQNKWSLKLSVPLYSARNYLETLQSAYQL